MTISVTIKVEFDATKRVSGEDNDDEYVPAAQQQQSAVISWVIPSVYVCICNAVGKFWKVVLILRSSTTLCGFHNFTHLSVPPVKHHLPSGVNIIVSTAPS